mgnify:FL=1|tara:strand:+ start:138 stop:581 length:444 start_codon:yes stop_codon:yes gene_type:complete
MKKILYIDMDNVLVNFQSGLDKIDLQTQSKFDDKNDEIPGIFSLMEPVEGAIEAFEKLSALYDTYILSTAPWENPSAWTDKLLWVKKYLGEKAKKRLILSHHKNLNHGDFLIDDRPNRGAKDFQGEWLEFGPGKKFPDWNSVLTYLC